MPFRNARGARFVQCVMGIVRHLPWVLAAGLFAAASAHAVTLYKIVAPDGRVTYTDQPPPRPSGNVTPIEVDPGANRARPPAVVAEGETPDYGQIIRRRPPEPDTSRVDAARRRVDEARGALLALQENSTEYDWVYFGTGRGRAPRPEYLAKLEAAERDVAAAEAALAEAERR